MSVRVEETPQGATVKVRIEGENKADIYEARDRYLIAYNPCGYGTTFGVLTMTPTGFALIGDRYDSAD
jgi:hypothetical protein